MKGIIKTILMNSVIIFFLSLLFPGVQVHDGLAGFLISGFFLSLGLTLVKPIIMLVTIPLSIITLGLYALISNVVSTAIIFYGVQLFSPQFVIKPFTTPPLALAFLHIPPIPLNYFFTFLFIAIWYAVLKGILSWAVEE